MMTNLLQVSFMIYQNLEIEKKTGFFEYLFFAASIIIIKVSYILLFLFKFKILLIKINFLDRKSLQIQKL